MIRTKPIQTADYKLIDGTENHWVFHKNVLVDLKKKIKMGSKRKFLTVGAYDTFSSEISIEEHLKGVSHAILESYEANQFFDFGVVENETVIALSGETNTNPIQTPPWEGSTAVFTAYHPDSIVYKVLSLYVLQLLDDNTIVMSEAFYNDKNNDILVMGSLVASFPLSWKQDIKLLGGVQGAQNLGPSIVNPVLMGCAFLRKDFRETNVT